MGTPGPNLDIALLRRPASAALLALVSGLLLGPLVLRLLGPRPIEDGAPIGTCVGIALLVCLFCLGLRLRLPFEWRFWRISMRLATLSLLAAAALAAAGAHLLFDLGVGQSLLLGAILAPTDSVLACESGPADSDHDGAAFTLSAESGINSGLAPALVAILLGYLGVGDWEVADAGWASVLALLTAAGGFACGWLVGAGAARARAQLDPERQSDLLEEILVFGAAPIAYCFAVAVHADGFLAVFGAGVALSHGGRVLRPLRNRPLMPRLLRIAWRVERGAWLCIVLLLGILVESVDFKLRMLLFAALVLLLIRPLAVRLGLGTLALPETQWRSIAWFCGRGVASLYCLAFALDHGLDLASARQLSAITVVVLVSSLLAGALAGLPLSLSRRGGSVTP